MILWRPDFTRLIHSCFLVCTRFLVIWGAFCEACGMMP